MSAIRQGVKHGLAALVRGRTPVLFGDLSRTAPVSRVFGLDRGMPVDRHYIQDFLSRHHRHIAGVGVEIGETKYLDMFPAGLTARRILVPSAGIAKPGADVIVADLSKPDSVPQGVADSFVCTQTLNFIYDVKAALQGAHRLLKPGGVFLGTVSGLSQVSRYDAARWGDYWRFMPQALDALLREAFGDQVILTVMGNALAAQALLQGLAVEDLPDPALLDVADPDYPVILGFVAHKS